MKVFRTSVLFTFLFSACSYLPSYTAGEVPFVPTPPEVVNRMLDLADIKPGDVVYDVGSGDGRIVISPYFFAAAMTIRRRPNRHRGGKKIRRARGGHRDRRGSHRQGAQPRAQRRRCGPGGVPRARRAHRRHLRSNGGDDLHAAGVQLQAPAETGGAKAWHARRLPRLRRRGLDAHAYGKVPRPDRAAHAHDPFLQAVKSERVFLQDRALRQFRDVFALQELARGEALAVAVRHVGAEDDLLLTDETQHLRQELILHFGAEVEVAAPDILHRRQLLYRRGVGDDLRKIFRRVL